MNLAEVSEYLATGGLELARYFHTHDAGFGFSEPDVRLYRSIGETYFGPCSEKAVRARVIEYARSFPVSRLVVIHKAAAQLRKDAAVTRWELRLELAQLTRLSEADLAAYANERVRELNQGTRRRPPRSLVIGRRTDATGRRTAMLKLPEDEMSQFEGTIRQMIRGRKLPEDIAMGNACWTLLTGGEAVGESTIEPTVLVTASDMQGVGEEMLQATDGTRVHAASYLAERLPQLGWVLLYDAAHQPVNLWRTHRLANETQRRIIAADQLVCAWPGCDRTAIYGVAHHVTAWHAGGQTNLDNLIGLCGPHNAMNDDDLSRQRNGYVGRDETGQPVWHPPDGGPPVPTGHARSGRAQAVRLSAAQTKPGTG